MRRLLIVDDEVAIRRSLRRGLRLQPFLIEDFSDPAAALARHLEERFHAAILDLRMPGMNGVELARRLMDVAEVEIVFLTGEGDSPLAAEARLLGRHIVMKPWEPVALARILDELGEKAGR